MKKILVFLFVAAVFFFIMASPVYAFTAKGGQTVNVTGSENDDLYVTGGNINVSSDINGDLVAAGGQLSLKGNVFQDLIAAGGTINIGGQVMDDIRAAGGNITLDGIINDDVVVAGGQVTINTGTQIKGDLVAAGGTVIINGNISGKVFASGGNIDISGKIGNGVEISSVGALTVGSTAEISGDLLYSSSQKASIDPGAKISGETRFTEIVKNRGTVKPSILAPGILGGLLGIYWLTSKVVEFLSIFVLGIILILLIPLVFKKFMERMKLSPGRNVAAGAIMLFGTTIGMSIIFFIGIILMLTIIGSGLGLLLFASLGILIILYLALIYLGTIFLAFLIGRLILHKTRLNMSKYGWNVLAYLIGLVIIMLVYAIPFAGGVARFAGILFGFGGLVMVIKDWIWLSANKIKENKKGVPDTASPAK